VPSCGSQLNKGAPMFMLAAFILICPAIVAFALAFAVCWKWQRKFTCLQEKMDRLRGKTRAAGGLWAYRWSNRAFDEYRAEMLRRLDLAYPQSAVSSSPKLYTALVPARAAYSHSASVGNR
jgi:Protein of unknown function (DUF2852)